MKRYKTVDEFILDNEYDRDILIVLREIIKSTELEETVKWGAPCYTYKGKNVVGLSSFKSYVGLWFFQGALLKDPKGVLINAAEDKTKAQRQWRFNSIKEVNESVLRGFIAESIHNINQNKAIKADRNKELIIPEELQAEFESNPALKSSFYHFTFGKQREFADHIAQPKQEKTRLARLKKIIPMIQQGIGLNDKYRR
jgi:uncharacterized protein YdeI (YjbR/CyaY-like superfamily)